MLRLQQGVIARRQLLAADLTRPDIETLLRRRELVPVHPGVYVSHTGQVTYRQRCWAAVLYAWPAALTLRHALPGPPSRAPVDVAIDWSRRVATRPGIRVHRVRELDALVLWAASPPRVRIEAAALAVAHRAQDDLEAIAVLAGAVGSRRTTADRLSAGLETTSRLRRRALLSGLMQDLALGTHSVLEHGFLDRVLRPHGLPAPSRLQAPRRGPRGTEYRDVELDCVDADVELDGSTHDSREQRDLDADRDLADLASGRVTPRLRYPQVFGTPCRTALQLAAFFRHRGWQGQPVPCSPLCGVGAAGSLVPLGAGQHSPLVRPSR